MTLALLEEHIEVIKREESFVLDAKSFSANTKPLMRRSWKAYVPEDSDSSFVDNCPFPLGYYEYLKELSSVLSEERKSKALEKLELLKSEWDAVEEKRREFDENRSELSISRSKIIDKNKKDEESRTEALERLNLVQDSEVFQLSQKIEANWQSRESFLSLEYETRRKELYNSVKYLESLIVPFQIYRKNIEKCSQELTKCQADLTRNTSKLNECEEFLKGNQEGKLMKPSLSKSNDELIEWDSEGALRDEREWLLLKKKFLSDSISATTERKKELELKKERLELKYIALEDEFDLYIDNIQSGSIIPHSPENASDSLSTASSSDHVSDAFSSHSLAGTIRSSEKLIKPAEKKIVALDKMIKALEEVKQPEPVNFNKAFINNFSADLVIYRKKDRIHSLFSKPFIKLTTTEKLLRDARNQKIEQDDNLVEVLHFLYTWQLSLTARNNQLMQIIKTIKDLALDTEKAKPMEYCQAIMNWQKKLDETDRAYLIPSVISAGCFGKMNLLDELKKKLVNQAYKNAQINFSEKEQVLLEITPKSSTNTRGYCSSLFAGAKAAFLGFVLNLVEFDEMLDCVFSLV